MSLAATKAEAPQQTPFETTLADRCRNVIVRNLEKYPPEAFAILDELEWESLVQLKYESTRPKVKGIGGGLGGTGRIAPAVSDKFLSQVEEACPHLAESTVVDEIVWKDCVETKFKVGGLTRPRGLLYPWPILVGKLQRSGTELLDSLKPEETNEEDRRVALRAIRSLSESPMSVSLLKASGVGAKVKKFLKKCSCLDLNPPFPSGGLYNYAPHASPKALLEYTLQSWMDMAGKSGVVMNNNSQGAHSASSDDVCDASDEHQLALAEKCESWRALFSTLKEHDEERKSNQGAKMRERRKNRDSVRPKIVKVRPATNARQTAILKGSSSHISTSSRSGSGGGSSSSSAASGTSKLQQIKMEASVTSSRRCPPVHAKLLPAGGRGGGGGGGGFGAAVAFAAISKKTNNKRKATTTLVALAHGKRMKVPDAKRAGVNMKKRLGMLKTPQGRSPPRR
jgi:hypothetical protein